MRCHHPVLQPVILVMLLLIVSTPTLAGNFATAYQDCLNAFKAQPTATEFCAPETCGYRACIADHALGLQYGDIVVSGGRLTTIPAECKPYQDVMQRCIIQHLNNAIPASTPEPNGQGVSGLWNISQSNGYYGTLELKQGQNGQLTGRASFNRGLSGTIVGSVSGHTIQFTISYPGGLKGSYTGTLSNDGLSISNAGSHSNTNDSASWEANKQ